MILQRESLLGILLAILLSGGGTLPAQPIEPALVEKVGQPLPLEGQYVNENGQIVALAEVIDKPTLLTFTHARCLDHCGLLLNRMVRGMNTLDLYPGLDYQVVSVCVDELENLHQVQETKNAYLSMLNHPFAGDHWSWLMAPPRTTGDLAHSVGLLTVETGAFPAVIIVLSRNGTIVRYFRGLHFSPFDLKMALLEGSEKADLSALSQIQKFCYHYDLHQQAYTLDHLKVFGTLALFSLLLASGIVLLDRREGGKSLRRLLGQLRYRRGAETPEV